MLRYVTICFLFSDLHHYSHKLLTELLIMLFLRGLWYFFPLAEEGKGETAFHIDPISVMLMRYDLCTMV